jgi:acyl-CoA synthetase (AMP-forming)/AMP-acid ligase II
VVRGYFGEPPAPADRWLRTGDLGYLADGDLVICGREKDVLFAAGRNVFPQDVEAAAAQTRGVRPGGVVAFGVPAARSVTASSSRWSRDTGPTGNGGCDPQCRQRGRRR